MTLDREQVFLLPLLGCSARRGQGLGKRVLAVERLCESGAFQEEWQLAGAYFARSLICAAQSTEP
jgi:hypothetical protein